MDQEIFEWLLLLGRWLHITVAMAWIGASFFFMWLDRTLQNNELWMVHGGGFYQVKKHLMGPTRVPNHLHWFKWESYWTWLSGLFLVILVFYTGNGTFLLDSSVSQVTYWQAVGISVASMLVSWLYYDFLWESKLAKNKPIVGHLLTLLWFVGMSYFLCHTLSGRAAYIHVGGMLGTWMTANVFLRIIPRQLKMVEAAKLGETVNQEWSKNAKNRSTHNTYFTLPVIFIMLSNHFPMTYGHNFNWLILLVISAAGAAIREYFVVRLQNPIRAKIFAAVGVVLILGVMFFTKQKTLVPIETYSAKVSVENLGPTANVKGVVKFVGPVPVGEKLQLPLECRQGREGETFSNEVVVNNGRIKNVLIRITKGLEGKVFGDVPETPVLLDQIDCLYEPRVIGVRVGQKIEIINSDSLFHNVRALTKNNEEFNISMPQKNDRFTKVFMKPEVFLQTKCSVHPWMSAYIAVIEHPFFSVTNDTGEFLIKDLPYGNYALEIWHEVFGVQTKEISVTKDQDIEFTFKRE
ncbi:MAG: urate hydroxylase PuuD [Pseudomonadota bacterium]|nr:urate hydroxylase PuuD [Pseudomonadota bacterium]